MMKENTEEALTEINEAHFFETAIGFRRKILMTNISKGS